MARIRNVLIVLAVVWAALAAPAGAGTLQQALNNGRLRIAVTVAAPWVLRDEDGKLDGFEIDVAERLAADLGLEPVFVIYQFDELIRAIETGEVDIIVSGLTITPERALHVNFSRPYATSGIALATNTGTTADVTRLDDLSAPKYTVGAVQDSAGAELAAALLPRANLVEFEDQAAAGRALVSGDIDAYLDEQPAPTFLSLDYPGLIDLPVQRPLLETRSGFAVAKGDPDFLAFLNAWVEAREADTFLPSTHQYWFESLRWRRQ